MTRFSKRLTALALALVLLAGLLPLRGGAAMFAHYLDVSAGAWYYDYVRQSYEQGLMNGTSQSTFSPNLQLTRGMFVTVLGRMAGVETGAWAEQSGFSDVDSARYYAPYVSWAQAMGITNGMSHDTFAPDLAVTREQMATMIARYVAAAELTLPPAQSPAAPFADAARVSPWAREGLELMRQTGILRGNAAGQFQPDKATTRAEAATVFVRLNLAIYGDKVPQIHTWMDREVLTPADVIPETPDGLVSRQELIRAADDAGLQPGSPALDALISINTVYGPQLTGQTGPFLFFFEGCGVSDDPNARMNAMAVVVKDGAVAYLNRSSTTIPDYPFTPSRNDDKRPMPTLRSGVYPVSATNQYSRAGSYAALKVEQDQVVRFRNRNDYYLSTSGAINVHRRTTDEIVPEGQNWVNSAGCLLVGRSGKTAQDDYAGFIAAFGLVQAGSSGSTRYQNNVSGLLVVDRTYARAYLRAIGYPDEALDMIG